MNNLSKNTKDLLFNFLAGKLSLNDIETFLFKSNELECSFEYDDYIDLLSLNFNINSSKYEAIKLIKKNIDISEYEIWRLNEIFENIVSKGNNYPESIASLYDLYCRGYYFLEKLAFNYGLTLSFPREYDYEINLSELSQEEQQTMADRFYPKIISHVNLIQELILSNKIIITGELDEYDHYDYIDNMNEEERSNTV